NTAPNCNNQLTPVPADNHSVLVTVRLVVRPSLFLSRNSGILTGVTGITAPGGNQPIQVLTTGPAANVTQLQGTSIVPDWLYNGTANSGDVFLSGTNGINSGPAIC